MSFIIDTVRDHLPAKRKTTPSGWISFNAVCCHHRSNSMDHRQRGGLIFTADSVSYHCFNCQFKTGYQQGRTITARFRNLLRWLGVTDDLITKCTLESLRLKEDSSGRNYTARLPAFTDRALPKGSKLIADCLDSPCPELLSVCEYLTQRDLYLGDYPFYWTDQEGFGNRVIIPYYYQERLVGYTARRITEGRPKYISEQQPGYVFNLDGQAIDNRFVIVCEGQIDAISINGVAVMSSEVQDPQRLLIDNLAKEVIVVPDRDHEGPKIVKQAIEFGWAVSFPDWEEVKDINESAVKYGRLATLYKIVSAVERSELRIRLRSRQWFKGYADV